MLLDRDPQLKELCSLDRILPLFVKVNKPQHSHFQVLSHLLAAGATVIENSCVRLTERLRRYYD